MKPGEDPGRLRAQTGSWPKAWLQQSSSSRRPELREEREEDPWASAADATRKVAGPGEKWLHVHQGRADTKGALPQWDPEALKTPSDSQRLVRT